MKWLTLDYIKKHSRIDFDVDDDILELYANAAETAVLNVCNRTEDELKEMGDGSMPDPIMQATLMLVDHSYQQRSPASAQQLYTVPYTFDFLVKPYIKL